MFKKVISAKGFWKSVLYLGIAFALLFVVIKWAIEGFEIDYFKTIENPIFVITGLLLSGLVYGFLVSFGKFRGKLKKDEFRK